MDKKIDETDICDIFPPGGQLITRLDGKNFSKWTKKFNKPFDKNITKAFIDVSEVLLKETGALIIYTHSDEINIIHDPRNFYFGGKRDKINSVLSSICTANFNKEIQKNKNVPLAFFDARTFRVPHKRAAFFYLLDRQTNGIANSIVSTTRSYDSWEKNMSAYELQQKLLFDYGIDWEQSEEPNKYGTFLKFEKTNVQLTKEQIKNLPKQHDYFKDPENYVFQRQILIKTSTRDIVKISKLFLGGE